MKLEAQTNSGLDYKTFLEKMIIYVHIFLRKM